jgi:hypothetical protein
MNIQFEHDYQAKVLSISFTDKTMLSKPKDIMMLRQRWLEALKTWHSPYKALLNLENLEIEDTPEIRDELARMAKFLTGFFLKKAVAYNAGSMDPAMLPFDVASTEEEALSKVGLRKRPGAREATDFRSSIQLTNDFQRQVVEMNFIAPAVVSSAEQAAQLKSKMTNNLMQWHSPWNLLIDCSQLTFADQGAAEFEKLLKYFKSFFLKAAVGYSPAGPKDSYPFKTYRARHKAVAELVPEGNFSADEANCRSRKATSSP